MTPEDRKVFDDWWRMMSERGASSEVISESGIEIDTEKHGCNYEEGDPVSPDELSDEDREKVMQHYGRIQEMREALADDGHPDYEDNSSE